MSDAHNAMYGRRWKDAKAIFLRSNPLCVDCNSRGILTAAKAVDHKVPHKGDYALFWDRDNWQPMCGSCHNRKTAREDGAFGNKGSNKTSSSCGFDGLPVDRRHHWNTPGVG